MPPSRMTTHRIHCGAQYSAVRTFSAQLLRLSVYTKIVTHAQPSPSSKQREKGSGADMEASPKINKEQRE
ncbi:Uncharacterized protein APZ42_021562 [Daphnia magna]|uniref:Uncharacterized protein n=1 Tax=Daphnia magna TaxID=35525 RepID=A0A164WK68_9CRUS|nr:Uncharacterized protein APZ42_021562 [Daphnia magna]